MPSDRLGGTARSGGPVIPPDPRPTWGGSWNPGWTGAGTATKVPAPDTHPGPGCRRSAGGIVCSPRPRHRPGCGRIPLSSCGGPVSRTSLSLTRQKLDRQVCDKCDAGPSGPPVNQAPGTGWAPGMSAAGVGAVASRRVAGLLAAGPEWMTKPPWAGCGLLFGDLGFIVETQRSRLVRFDNQVGALAALPHRRSLRSAERRPTQHDQERRHVSLRLPDVR